MADPAIGALIPIRLGSSRLPGKALAPIQGRTAVEHLLDRCFASRHLAPSRVVVCTTREAADDALVPVVERAGVSIFRGSTDDLVDRLYRAATAGGFDVIVEVDGDDICVDPHYIDTSVDRLLKDDRLDLVYTDGLPLGLSSKAVRMRAFAKVFELYQPGRNDTGFMYYLTRSGLFTVETMDPESPLHVHDTARLTLDYEEDLAFFRAIFEELYRPGEVFGVAEIVALLARRPELLRINGDLSEKYWERTRDLVAGQGLAIRTPEGVRRIEG